MAAPMRAQPRRSTNMMAEVLWFSIMSTFMPSGALSKSPTGNFSPGGFCRDRSVLVNSLVAVDVGVLASAMFSVTEVF